MPSPINTFHQGGLKHLKVSVALILLCLSVSCEGSYTSYRLPWRQVDYSSYTITSRRSMNSQDQEIVYRQQGSGRSLVGYSGRALPREFEDQSLVSMQKDKKAYSQLSQSLGLDYEPIITTPKKFLPAKVTVQKLAKKVSKRTETAYSLQESPKDFKTAQPLRAYSKKDEDQNTEQQRSQELSPVNKAPPKSNLQSMEEYKPFRNSQQLAMTAKSFYSMKPESILHVLPPFEVIKKALPTPAQLLEEMIKKIVPVIPYGHQSPVSVAYVNRVGSWWPAQNILKAIGVPGFASAAPYTHFVYSFWTTKGPLDIALFWTNPTKYLGTETILGVSNEAIRYNIKRLFAARNCKLLVSAFGSEDKPTTKGADPVKTAKDLATFVTDYNFDGVDVDWEDTEALEKGIGEEWLITFQKQLFNLLPGKIITHAPQAAYFSPKRYPKGGYLKVHKTVGNTISQYYVQYYNQGDGTPYDTEDYLFYKSNGFFPETSVMELIANGIPKTKIVIGKPASKADATNTGVVTSSSLAAWFSKAKLRGKWSTGFSVWQFASDMEGAFAIPLFQALKN